MGNFVFYPVDYKYTFEIVKEYPIVFSIISGLVIIVLLIACLDTWGDRK